VRRLGHEFARDQWNSEQHTATELKNEGLSFLSSRNYCLADEQAKAISRTLERKLNVRSGDLHDWGGQGAKNRAVEMHLDIVTDEGDAANFGAHKHR